MTRKELIQQILAKKSYLCIGLDTDINKIPSYLLKEKDPIFEFNKIIIEETQDLCVAYKPNLAFYESLGSKGWESLEKTMALIPEENYTIADAKRGDIGNTSSMYAKAFFERLNFDSVTVAPYMGEDSVKPFLDFDGKWVILLALTSNLGSKDFQYLRFDERRLFEQVIEKSQEWSTNENLMYVVGATQATELANIRKIAPEHFLLVPGVGAQGGSLEEVSKYGMNRDCGLLVNSSRGIIYQSSEKDFGKMARKAAYEVKQSMEKYLDLYLK